MALTYKPKKIISTAKIAHEIPADKPIVFWDSCMLLYILSISLRKSFEDFDDYKKLLGWIESDTVTSVTSSIVWEEFSMHFAEEKTKAENDQDNLKKVLRSYASCLDEPAKSDIEKTADVLKLVPVLEDMEERVWRKTYVIKDSAELRKSAHFRVLYKMSPSEKKDQYKDSLIWVTFLQMANSLPKPLYEIFVTANKEDFCTTKKGTDPQRTIAENCTTVNADFAVEINTVVNKITRELRV